MGHVRRNIDMTHYPKEFVEFLCEDLKEVN